MLVGCGSDAFSRPSRSTSDQLTGAPSFVTCGTFGPGAGAQGLATALKAIAPPPRPSRPAPEPPPRLQNAGCPSDKTSLSPRRAGVGGLGWSPSWFHGRLHGRIPPDYDTFQGRDREGSPSLCTSPSTRRSPLPGRVATGPERQVRFRTATRSEQPPVGPAGSRCGRCALG